MGGIGHADAAVLSAAETAFFIAADRCGKRHIGAVCAALLWKLDRICAGTESASSNTSGSSWRAGCDLDGCAAFHFVEITQNGDTSKEMSPLLRA